MDDDSQSISFWLPGAGVDNKNVDRLSAAVAARPDNAALHCDLAVALQNAGRLEQAAEHYRRAVEIDASLRPAWYNLGCLFNADGREAAAVPCLRRSIELDPHHAASHHNLGQALFNLGETDGAIEQYRRAIALDAGRLSETMLAMTVAVGPAANPATVLETRRAWANRYLPQVTRKSEIANESLAAASSRLRLGYVSAFFDHPNWMKPVWALINRHDRERFELFLYSDGKPELPPVYRTDPRDSWRWTSRQSNVEMAKTIAADRLDLLIDLNGYSRLPRLEVFAQRPARVQAAWFNMFATSGSTAFDYLIGDETVIGVAAKENGGPDFVVDPNYSERLVPLAGCYLTFEVAHPAPEVAQAPFLTVGHFTFGSLASLYKITPQIVALWSRILRQCPASRLLLRNSGFRSACNRAWIADQFARHGVEPERLTLLGPADHFEFLRTYNRIDLALDTFPYNGGTTTTEALWQGVPVVAIHGDRWTSRVSASLLRNAGLEAYVAADPDAYVQLAVAAAADPRARERLAKLRIALRDRLRESSVCDTDAFARRIEAAYEVITL